MVGREGVGPAWNEWVTHAGQRVIVCPPHNRDKWMVAYIGEGTETLILLERKTVNVCGHREERLSVSCCLRSDHRDMPHLAIADESIISGTWVCERFQIIGRQVLTS